MAERKESKTFACTECSCTYTRKHKLIQHLKEKHPNAPLPAVKKYTRKAPYERKSEEEKKATAAAKQQRRRDRVKQQKEEKKRREEEWAKIQAERKAAREKQRKENRDVFIILFGESSAKWPLFNTDGEARKVFEDMRKQARLFHPDNLFAKLYPGKSYVDDPEAYRELSDQFLFLKKFVEDGQRYCSGGNFLEDLLRGRPVFSSVLAWLRDVKANSYLKLERMMSEFADEF